MGIDTSIYQNMLKPPKSVADYDNEYSAARQNKLAEMMQQQTGQLNAMKMDEYRQGQERTNRLNTLLGGFKPDTAPDDQVGQLTRGGFLPEARTLAESSAKVAKERRDAEKAQLEGTVQKLALGAQILGGVRDQASYDAARATAQAHGLDVSRMPPEFNPAFVAQKLQEGQTVKEQLEQVWKQKGYDLDVQKVGETQRHNKSTEGLTAQGQQIQVRGQNMTDSRARAGQAQSASQHAATLAQGGKPPPGYRFTADGNMQAIPGGPADLKINAAGVAKTSDAKDVLSLLDEVDALLPKATGSYVGAGLDSLARSVGYGTPGAQSGSQLKALEGALIAKMPKMSGPQSDKDVLLYKQMAGQIGDATIPASVRQAASMMIRKLNEKHAGVTSSPPAASPKPTNAKGWPLMTDASGNKAYVSPDGKQFEEVR